MTIWKYQLGARRQTLDLPIGAQVLTVQVQDGAPCIWAMVDPDAPTEARKFATHGTGWEYPGDHVAYIGTYQLNGGALVFHVFEVPA